MLFSFGTRGLGVGWVRWGVVDPSNGETGGSPTSHDSLRVFNDRLSLK